MAIARVAATNASSATLSSAAGAAGDIIIWDAYRDTAATIPTLPSGVANPAILSGSGSVNAYLTTFEFCTSSSAQSRTFTGATRVVATRYSGVLGIGNAIAGAIATTSPANFAAVSLLQTGTTSWWKGGGGHKTSTIGAPSGMTAIANGQAGTGPSLTAYDTNGAINSNWPSTNVTVPAAAHCTWVVELLGGKSTWSAILKGSGCVLSNSNLTVVKSSGATTVSGLGSLPRNGSGLVVFRIDGTNTNVSDMSPGLASSIGMALNGFIDYFGWSNSGKVFVNGSLITTIDIWQAGSNTLYLAFNFTTGNFWGKVVGGAGWNASGTANPDTGVGGINIGTVPTQPCPAYDNDQTDAGTLVFDGTASGHGLSTFTPWDSFAVNDNVSLTGVSATAGVGSFAGNVSFGLTGTNATAGIGSFVTSLSVPLTGAVATCAVGNLAPRQDASVNLTGVSCAGSTGSFGLSVAIGAIGVSASGVAGSFAAAGGVPLSGNAAAAAIGGFIPSIAFSLTGIVASCAADILSTGGNTSAALTGTSATAQTESFGPSVTLSLSGIAATAAAGVLVGSIGALLSGTAAFGQVGNFALAGQLNVSLQGISATAAPGSFAGQGQAQQSGIAVLAALGAFGGQDVLQAAGVAALGQIGNFSFPINDSAALPGIFATAQIGGFTVTGALHLTIMMEWLVTSRPRLRVLGSLPRDRVAYSLPRLRAGVSRARDRIVVSPPRGRTEP